MKYNNLFYFQQKINPEWCFEKVTAHVKSVMDEINCVYSVIFKYSQEESCIIIRYSISENNSYNTIKEQDVMSKLKCILDHNHYDKPILDYLQPPLDLIVEIYEPLVHKLASIQHRRWQSLEYDDLCQMCRLTLVQLYDKGYYIHKSLLEKSFNNCVLQEIRNLSNEVNFISFETRVDGEEDMEKLTLEDTLYDVSEEQYNRDKEDIEITNHIFEEVKSILIDLMGPRQFEQLFRDYANGHTSTWSRRKMQTIKVMFEKEGLNRQKFNNKYGR